MVLDAFAFTIRIPLPVTNHSNKPRGTFYCAATHAPSTQVTHLLEERARLRRLPGFPPGGSRQRKP
jgi:hypothetical protein